MSNKRYPEEFKIEAVKQVTERGHPVAEVASRIGVSQHSLYEWLKRLSLPPADRNELQGQARDPAPEDRTEAGQRGARHTKKGRSVLCQRVPVRYAFIQSHETRYPVRRLCHVMDVHPSGYYAWKAEPASPRRKDDQRLLGLIKQSWLESGSVYGYRKITHDLRDLGEHCGKHRVYRLMKQEGLRAQVGYRRRAGHYGKPAVVAENQLEQNFDVEAPNQVWVTDITYIRTHEGWLYLAVVLDLFSRQVIGWSMRSRIDSELAINALLMAVWRRSPKAPVIVHSYQGCQYSSHDWRAFLKAHGLVASMSRRGNCYDNAVAESFFQLLKRERIRRRTYLDREEARRDVFNYIEMFYNPKRRHGYANDVSPVEFENQYFNRLQSV